MYLTTILTFVLTVTSTMLRTSDLCSWEPVAYLPAGSDVSMTIEDQWAKRCQAVLQFADPDFLPMVWSFDSIDCDGVRVNKFEVPIGAPDGEAVITWDCEDSLAQSCSHVIIQGGQGDLDLTPLHQQGVTNCLPEPLVITPPKQTTPATETTPWPSPTSDSYTPTGDGPLQKKSSPTSPALVTGTSPPAVLTGGSMTITLLTPPQTTPTTGTAALAPKDTSAPLTETPLVTPVTSYIVVTNTVTNTLTAC